MNIPAYTRFELVRALSNRYQIFFTLLMPAFLFMVFGATQSYKDLPVREGNVSASIMIGMAMYGAVAAATAQAAQAALELSHGWGRQLQLTALKPRQFVLVKTTVCVVLAALPVLVVNVLGLLNGATMPVEQWLASAALSWLLSTVFALYGLAAGLLFPSESAVGLATGALVVWAFFGNLFAPLSGTMLEIGRFTPLYGVRGLAQYPLARGDLNTGAPDQLWALLLNVAAWILVLALVCAMAYRRRAGQR